MTIETIGQVYNPITGVFGDGNVRFFTSSGTWVVPQGVGKVRVRMWGAGGTASNNSACYGGGGGGGFALKTIYDLTGVTSVAVTVGAGVLYSTLTTTVTSGTSSFGSYCSATGGSTPSNSPIAGVNGAGGTGVGGDINTSGGYGYNNSSSSQGGGGGSGSIFGNGGNSASTTTNPAPSTGGAGAGHGSSSPSITYLGGNGFFTNGGVFNQTTNYIIMLPQASAINSGTFPLDFIGTGGGGAYYQNGVNGGGGAYNFFGGFPGGGSGYGATSYPSTGGLVIVEW